MEFIYFKNKYCHNELTRLIFFNCMKHGYFCFFPDNILILNLKGALVSNFTVYDCSGCDEGEQVLIGHNRDNSSGP